MVWTCHKAFLWPNFLLHLLRLDIYKTQFHHVLWPQHNTSNFNLSRDLIDWKHRTTIVYLPERWSFHNLNYTVFAMHRYWEDNFKNIITECNQGFCRFISKECFQHFVKSMAQESRLWEQREVLPTINMMSLKSACECIHFNSCLMNQEKGSELWYYCVGIASFASPSSP